MRIELNDVSKNFGDQKVLRDVTFQDEVTTMAIIGPSGGGKSTLLRIIGGLSTPTSGTVTVGGTKVDFQARSLPAYRATLGFVFQHSGLFAHLTALENIALPLHAVHGVGEDEARDTAADLLRRFGLEGAADKHPSHLSGGERQRVAIGRAIAPRPRLLLLDEPTSALDPEYTAEVLDLIDDLRRQDTRFMIVTHEMGFARKACDKVAFLYDGHIAEYGASEQIFNEPGSPELTRFLGKLSQWA